MATKRKISEVEIKAQRQLFQTLSDEDKLDRVVNGMISAGLGHLMVPSPRPQNRRRHRIISHPEFWP